MQTLPQDQARESLWEDRDLRIAFDEEAHEYHVDGNLYPSVTSVISEFFSKFNADAVITRMMRSPKWPNSKYFGQTREQIKAGWEEKKQRASELGTRMHAQIESFLLNGEEADSEEFALFKTFWSARDLEPIRVEWRIFDESLRVAGTLDLLARDRDGRVYLIDWKRKEKMETNHWGRFARMPLDAVPDADYHKASLQLNLYRRILAQYNVVVDVMELVQIHPDVGMKTHVAQDFSTEIDLLCHEMEMAL